MRATKRILSMVMAIVLMVGVLPSAFITASAATTLTEEQFATKIAALRKEYPDGQYWNKYNGVDSEGYAKAGSQMCPGTTCKAKGYCLATCTCKCGQFPVEGAGQCFGFANLMAYKIFGSYATINVNSSGVNTDKGWKYHASVSTFYAGDVVRINNSHSLFITKVTDSDVYYVECNADGPCMIDWDNKTTISALKSKTTFVVRMSGNTLKGTGAETPVLTIKYNANGGTIENSDITGYTYKVAESDGLNMRSGAGTSYSVVTALANGTTFSVNIGDTKTANGYTWGKTTVNEKTGWVVISDFVSKTATLRATTYYIDSSVVYKTSSSAAHVHKMTYGETSSTGLYNASTFGLVREGYTFLGWSMSTEGGAVIDQDQALSPEEIVPELKDGDKSITLYAIWQVDESTHSHTAGEAVVENEVAATCTEAGSYDSVVKCSVCSAEISRVTVAVEATGHSYVDGKCSVCGEADPSVPVGPEYREELDFKKIGFNLGSFIGLQFAISNEAASGYDEVYVRIVMDIYNSDGVAEEKVYELREGQTAGSYLVFIHGVAPKLMGRVMNVQTIAVKDGVEYCGAAQEYSIKQGIIDRLNADKGNTTEKAINRSILMVDMLYYGAEAQKRFSQDQYDGLVTEDPNVAEFLSLRTAEPQAVTATNTEALKTENELYGYNLGLSEAVELQLTFTLTAGEHEAYTIQITCAGEVYTYGYESFQYAYSNYPNRATVVCGDLAAKQMRDEVTIVLLKNGKQVSKTYVARMEGVVQPTVANATHKNNALLKAMMAYGDSAKVYFG